MGRNESGVFEVSSGEESGDGSGFLKVSSGDERGVKVSRRSGVGVGPQSEKTLLLCKSSKLVLHFLLLLITYLNPTYIELFFFLASISIEIDSYNTKLS